MTGHPSDDELQRYRDRRLSPEDLLRVDDHIAGCARCRESIDPRAVAGAAAALRAALVGEAAAASGTGPPARWALAAALVLGLAGGWTLTRSHAPDEPAVSSGAEASQGSHPAGTPRSLGDAPAVERGNAHTTALPDRAVRLARYALDTGALWLDPQTLDLARGASRSRGGGKTRPFALVSPIAVSVASDRPVFRWSPLPGAAAYVVTVSDAAYRQAVESPPVTATEWRPRAPLARGRVYVWQVSARTASGEKTAPGPVDPEACFRVLEAARLVELQATERAAAGAPLVLAAARAADGLFDEAEAELVAFSARVPDDAVVRRLLEDLRRRRRGGAGAANRRQGSPSPSTTKPAQ